MKYIFYLLGVFPVLWESLAAINAKKVLYFADGIKKKKGEETNSTEKIWMFLMFLYALWVLIGIFTFQWELFLLLFLLSFIPFNNRVWLQRVDAIISLIILLFVIINGIHYHISLIDLIF